MCKPLGLRFFYIAQAAVKLYLQAWFQIELLQEEKNNRIKELENELLSVRQSHDNQIKFLNSNLENFKLEKENEINNLHKEIETIQAENEKDRKVLDEFQNMIRILEKIKGIFKKD